MAPPARGPGRLYETGLWKPTPRIAENRLDFGFLVLVAARELRGNRLAIDQTHQRCRAVGDRAHETRLDTSCNASRGNSWLLRWGLSIMVGLLGSAG